MGALATALRYKKTHKYIEHASVSLHLAQKSLRSEHKSPFRKNIDVLAAELTILSASIAKRNKLDSKMISLIQSITDSLTNMPERDFEDDANIATIERLQKCASELADQIKKYSSKSEIIARQKKPV